MYDCKDMLLDPAKRVQSKKKLRIKYLSFYETSNNESKEFYEAYDKPCLIVILNKM